MRSSIRFASILALALSTTAFAQSGMSTQKLPKGYLKTHGLTPKSGQAAAKTATNSKNKKHQFPGVAGIDSIANWTDAFNAPGYDYYGNPQTVWPYAMVGSAPESGRTTRIPAPIIPVTVQLLDPSGNVAKDPGTGAPLISVANTGIVSAVLNSPLFNSATYSSGTGQFNDEMQRAEFWNRLQHTGSGVSNSWHTLMEPSLKTPRTMSIPYGHAYYALNDDGTCCAYILADGSTFGNLLFPPTYPVDNTTVIGAAELAGDMTTSDLTTLLFNNVYLYNGSPSNCCVLGYHEYDYEPGTAQNGNLPRLYVMNYSSWITNGLFGGGFEDITATSHEISETFNDPFVNNETPWWFSGSTYPTVSGNCQANLETGDVIEVLSSNTVFPVYMSGRTYHPQNEALFSWFAFESPSPAHLGAYSFPDETTLTSLSPGPLTPGCANLGQLLGQ